MICVSWDFNAAGETTNIIIMWPYDNIIALIIGKEMCINRNVFSCVLHTDGRGNWTSKGCSNQTDGSGGNVTCSCNHLTNFAVLVVSRATALKTCI